MQSHGHVLLLFPELLQPIQKVLLMARVFDGCCDTVQVVTKTILVIPQWHSPSLNSTARPGGWAGRLGCWKLPGKAGPSPRAVSWECPIRSTGGGPFLQVARDLLAVSWVLPQALADTIVEPSLMLLVDKLLSTISGSLSGCQVPPSRKAWRGNGQDSVLCSWPRTLLIEGCMKGEQSLCICWTWSRHCLQLSLALLAVSLHHCLQVPSSVKEMWHWPPLWSETSAFSLQSVSHIPGQLCSNLLLVTWTMCRRNPGTGEFYTTCNPPVLLIIYPPVSTVVCLP
jgi:hypothetical protein